MILSSLLERNREKKRKRQREMQREKYATITVRRKK
jgi:hypothetical protein